VACSSDRVDNPWCTHAHHPWACPRWSLTERVQWSCPRLDVLLEGCHGTWRWSLLDLRAPWLMMHAWQWAWHWLGFLQTKDCLVYQWLVHCHVHLCRCWGVEIGNLLCHQVTQDNVWVQGRIPVTVKPSLLVVLWGFVVFDSIWDFGDL
jgi:hypothetical protein